MSGLNMERIRQITHLIDKNALEFAGAIVLNEIESMCNIEDEDFLLRVVEIAVDFYFDTDYATPTGIGVVTSSWLASLEEQKQDFLQMTDEQIEKEIREEFFASDWR